MAVNKTTPSVYNRDIAALLLLALLFRLLTAWPQQQPSYMDAAYYYVNAVNLAEGRGFVEDFVWNYLGEPGPPPQPSHLYWMPLTSILAALSMAIGGITYRMAQLPFILLSALLAPLSYGAAMQLTGRRWYGWLAGLLAIFSGFYVPFWTAIDNFAPFAVSGALALLTASWGGPWLFLSGLSVALAHLSRADGLLLLLPLILLTGWRRQWRGLLLLLFGYILLMTPWFVRNWQVTGAILPAGSQTIWLTTYDDLFAYGRTLSMESFLAQGWPAILAGRWFALTTNLQRVWAEQSMIFLLPFVIIGLWHGRGRPLVQLHLLYGGLLFVVMTVVFAFPGARGGLFHSGGALLPGLYAMALLGFDEAINWVAMRRRNWHAPSAKYVFGSGLILLAMGLSGFVYYQRVLQNDAWNRADRYYPAVAAWVAAQNPAATVMIGNPPAYRYHGGGLSVIIPNENITTTLRAMAEYQADYLVLEATHPQPLAPLYQQPEQYQQAGLSVVQTVGEEEKLIYIFALVMPDE